jgi:uncharacterized repeat protein (TIGR01451 family)
MAITIAAFLLMPLIPLSTGANQAIAVPNPVAADEPTYQAFGRVFPDPHGCLAYGVPDGDDANTVKDTPRGVSPWAKGRVCADQFLQYQEVLDGAHFLARRFPDYMDVIRLDQAYDNPDFMSAGIPRFVVNEDGKPKLIGRDRRPLYLFKVTHDGSTVPEPQREHFAYSMSIHGIERAGVEGGIRAMEDLVTWAACNNPKYAAPALPALPPPACAVEGPFPKKIVESASDKPVPTATEVLDRSVIYFVLPNPDGWARGQVAPVEVEDGGVNTNYVPGFAFQRYNGNGVDLNRDFPSKGYAFKPYSPGSEPETQALTTALSGIRAGTAAGQFAGGIDLHGMLTSHAFSYTLIGAGQRDYRKNALTVDTAVRTWQDQTARMAWSPYVADANANGVRDANQNEVCLPAEVSSGTRGHAPACVADEWGTVIDTIGYQITGGIGDWFDSAIGLNGIGINNEMFTSHLAPNSVFEPALEQTHIDGNKGLIFSQLASLLTAGATTFDPAGKVGYVFNPKRLQITEPPRPQNPGMPSQNNIDVTLPCRAAPVGQNVDGDCGPGTFGNQGIGTFYEFNVKGPGEGIWNSGITATYTGTTVTGAGVTNAGAMQLQHFAQGQWQTVAYHFRQGGGTTNPDSIGADAYLPAGQVVTINDPLPGRYRIYFSNPAEIPGRLRIDFENQRAEGQLDQNSIDASSMDFFDELNQFVPDAKDLQPIAVNKVINDPSLLSKFDSIVVVNNVGQRSFLTGQIGLTADQATTYFANLRKFASQGGNLVLTDAALATAAEIGLVAPNQVRQLTSGDETFAGNYAFQIGGNPANVTYRNAGPNGKYPLATGVNQPGAAEQELGRRQAVEPAPIGYSPDYGLDGTPKLPFWGINRPAWEGACGRPDCTAATTTSGNTRAPLDPLQPANITNLGEARLGQGVVRIGGIMFPDPIYAPDARNDHRFGLADYSLTYTGWEVFKNLINFERTVQAPAEADLSVAMSDNPDPATVGEPLTYTVEVANAGPDDATGISVSDQLPAGLAFRSASEGCAEAAGTVTCDVGTLGAGSSKQLTIEVSPTSAGAVTNAVRVVGTEVDPQPGNNTAAQETQVQPRRADLSVTLADAPDPVIVGNEITFTLAVANAGPQPATSATLAADLPDAVTFVSAGQGCANAAGIVTCDLGTLAAGGSATRTITVRADAPATLTTSATVDATEEDPAAANNAASITTTARCTITGTAGANTLKGTAARDVICGLGGDDTIQGLDGNDLLLGGDGVDTIQGNAGDDELRGGAGNDDLKGAEGNDRLFGGPGNDKLNGGPGTDACSVDEDGGTRTECEA